MKKSLSVMLVIVLVAALAGILGACGKGGKENETTEPTTSAVSNPYKDFLNDFLDDVESQTYEERTTDEHYEEEFEALTLPSAVPSTPSKTPTGMTTTKPVVVRETTTRFMFTSPSAPSTTKPNEKPTSGGNSTTTTTTTKPSGSGQTSASDSTSMTDNIPETNVGFGSGNVTDGGALPRPQVTYLDKYVLNILAGNSYTLRMEVKEDGMSMPMTSYKDGNNFASKVRLSNLIGTNLPGFGGADEVRTVVKDGKCYVAWAGGYVQLESDEFGDIVGSFDQVDINDMLRTDGLEYYGFVSRAGYVCESYRDPEANLGYCFYFTSEGITRWEIVDLETNQVVETMNISITPGIADKNAFALSGKKYTMEEFEKMFAGMAS